MMTRIFLGLVVMVLLIPVVGADSHALTSPNGQIEVHVDVDKELTYAVFVGGEAIISPSPISMTFDGGTGIGATLGLVAVDERSVDKTIRPVVAEKRSEIPDRYNELKLTLDGGHGVIFRAYDDGVAYRFFSGFDGTVKVKSEQATFAFAGDYHIYHADSDTQQCSFENTYKYVKLANIKPGSHTFAPVLIDIPRGPKVVLTESDLDDYPGMWLTRHARQANTLIGQFAAYPAEAKLVDDRHERVTKYTNYLAETAGTRTYPWRVIAIAERDGQLIENDIVFRLGPDLALDDVSWIRPGKVAWDWWNANNIWNVDFEAGINTATYKHYIDFAARHGIEYVILDEGWSNTRDLLDLSPDIDLHELIRYGNEKGVGIILWCVWYTMDEQLEEALTKFEQWGIKGVKVDFMDRDDQKMVQFYHRVARATGEHHLLLDYHGAYKPAGLRRAYPNLVTREGVLGLEYSKWSDRSDPEYAVTIPFIRMLAGPMDYTPGAMNNAQKDNFKSIFTRPMSQGTRTQQIAMYVVYESPLQMLCDTPTAYEQNPECLAFLSDVPTTWDDTRALEAQVADYVVVARRKGNVWYVGAMTDWTPRELTVDLSFLPPGTYKAQTVADGVNAHRIAIDHRHETQEVTADTILSLKLAPGGGWVAKISK